MPAPAYIEPAFNQVNAAVADVQTIIDNLRTYLLAIGWTEPVANTFRTPVNSNGRFMEVILTRNAATDLRIQMRDDFNRLSDTGRMNITGTQTIAYYYGAHYLFVENRSQEDWFYAQILSLSPESEVAHPYYCVVSAYRNPAGTANYGSVTRMSAFTLASGTYGAMNVDLVMMYSVLGLGTNSNAPILRTPTQARRWSPVWALGLNVSSVREFRGRFFNTLLMWNVAVNVGNTISIPVDESTTAAFRVLNISPAASTGGMRMAVRV